MKIIFEEDSSNGYTTYSAVVQTVKYKGKMRDELLYATISPSILKEKWCVDWEDEWDKNNPQSRITIEEAKKYILDNYKDHEPEIIGISWED